MAKSLSHVDHNIPQYSSISMPCTSGAILPKTDAMCNVPNVCNGGGEVLVTVAGIYSINYIKVKQYFFQVFY